MTSNSVATIQNKGVRDRFEHIYKSVSHWCKSGLDGDEKAILDFGCGAGVSALRFAIENPSSIVHGCDISDALFRLDRIAKEDIGIPTLPDNLELKQIVDGEFPFNGMKYDVIYSWSVFEHINIDLMDGIINNLKSILKPTGILFIQINPLYYSSRGAHLYDFVSDPWCHLIHQHDNLKEKVFSNSTKNINQKKFHWDEYEKLNKITADTLISFFKKNDFELIREDRTIEDLQPPESLLQIYNEYVLRTCSIKLLFKQS
jgi:SAM-dependent methyltransferase